MSRVLALRFAISEFRLAFLAVLVAALAVAACGDGDDGDDDDAGDSSSVPTPAGVTGAFAPKSDLGKKINEARIPEDTADGKRIGSADAKVKIEAYEDFGCPHCLEFTALIEPVIFKDYVAAGLVSFEYKYFPLRQLTGGAAITAQCAAEQNKFWEFHRGLFIAQAEANAKVGPALNEAFSLEGLRALAATAGLDSAAFEACIAGDSAIEVVQAEQRSANDLGLPGTPSFVINGQVAKVPANDDVDGWRKLLDDLLR